LDTKPTLESDLESDELEFMSGKLVEQRVNGEMMSAQTRALKPSSRLQQQSFKSGEPQQALILPV